MNNIIKDNNITKSNELINASYSLTLQEQRLILAVLGKYDQIEKLPDRCTLKASEFSELFKDIKLDYYKELIKAVNLLYDRDIKYLDDNQRKIERFRFISYIKYDYENSQVVIDFSKAIMPYISQLKSHFTTYKLKNIIKLKTTYSIRLFELIQQKYDLGELLIKVNDFRTIFKLENKYTRFDNLKRRVIEPAIKEIFLKLDFKVDFKAEKMGRSYEYLRFTWNENNNTPERLKITKVTYLDEPNLFDDNSK